MSINFQKIVTVVNKPGLYILKSHNNKGFFVESIESKHQIFVANAKAKVLALGNIDIACYSGTMALLDAFRRMSVYEGEIPTTREKDEALIQFFRKIVPDFDEKKVYPSTVRKMLLWFLLLNKSIKSFEDAVNEEDTTMGFDS